MICRYRESWTRVGKFSDSMANNLFGKNKSRINQEIIKLKIWLHHPPISCVTNLGETIAHKCCFELFPASRLDFCSATEFWLIYKRSWRSLKLFLFNLFLVSCLKLETDETRISFSHWHSHSRQCPRRKPKVSSGPLYKLNSYAHFRFDAADSCSDFNGHFSKFPGMKAVCKTNNGPIKKKWFCNLKCDNNYPNVWSTRPIKVSRPETCKFYELTVAIKQTVIELFSVKWEIWASQMKATPGNQTRSRVLILFVTKKMIVDHSKVNITFPTNSCHGANLNQLSEQPCSTLGESIFILLPVHFRSNVQWLN